MEKLVTSNLKLGIIAGGQLAKMLIQEASKWDIITYVLDMDEQCPARYVSSVYVKGSPQHYEDVYNFGKQVDILTFELENIHIEALMQLKSEGLTILPDPEILKIIQDKGTQKDFYSKHNIPTASYFLTEHKTEIISSLNNGKLKMPFVQKLRKGGYDGRGVQVVNSISDLDFLLEGASVIEEKINIQNEIAVIVARNKKGEIKCFPAVDMVFDPKANLVKMLVCPSAATEQQQKVAAEIATHLAESLNLVGLLAVEFFIDKNGKVLVNESAPRPHNSGHHTIESVITSQFEQHLRAILNLPLGSTKLKIPAVMINLLGEENYSGKVIYEGLTESMAMEGVKIHLYGKKITKPFRKMGHVTVISNDIEDAIRKAEKVQQTIKVKSWN
ncbi:MAG: 5-(carboxyamino)imidazole ribonucleotide synthase [Bacteroidales bacterium]|nr:5-(carboxyamino)imidazole ribonucleotide synthase [Bacteroidales bacterium]